eukprot:CAMPEP_0203762118 /NCGR_PEP_ID=MMETSP0098-20131031/15079_1 /ASSEMBLY_ACC=CAM_ASM_000208 /TAXON_ID=96639 /ORGANISM=" , Strain NY0313808BC1" /LENGTH=71 /DNA_ID=CAMNT_0050656407 /DNA_START=144 /DNA_END=356 /DNA_ORIENTATION=+
MPGNCLTCGGLVVQLGSTTSKEGSRGASYPMVTPRGSDNQSVEATSVDELGIGLLLHLYGMAQTAFVLKNG